MRTLFVNTLAAVGAGLLVMGCGGGSSSGSGGSGTTTAPTTSVHHTVVALPGGVEDATATESTSGLVVVTGGRTERGQTTAGTSLFDLATGQATPLPNGLTTARSGHGAARQVDGSVVVFGGTGADGRPLTSMERFDTVARTWALLPQGLQTPRSGVSSTVVGDLIVVSSEGEPTVELIDRNTLEPRGTLNLLEAPQYTQVVTAGSQAFLYGEPQSYWLDLQSLTATPTAELPFGGAAVAVGERIAVVGGVRPDGLPSERAHVVASDGTVETAGPLLPQVQRPTLVSLEDETFFIAGGLINDLPVGNLTRVDLDGNGTEALPALGEPRSGMAVVRSGNDLALFGGRTAVGPSALVDLLTIDPLGGTGAFAGATRTRDDRVRRENELARLTSERDAARARAQQLTQEIDQTRQTLAAERTRVAGLRTDLATAQQELAAAQARVAQGEAQVRQLDAQIRTLEQNIQANRNAAAQARAQRDRIRTVDIPQAQATAGSAGTRVQQLENDLTRAQNEVASLQSQIQAIEAQIRSAQAAAAAAARARSRTSGGGGGSGISVSLSVGFGGP